MRKNSSSNVGYDAIVRLISQYDVDVNDLFESNSKLDSKIKPNSKNEIVIFENNIHLQRGDEK